MTRFPAVKAFSASLAYYVTHAGTILKIIWLPALILTAVNLYLLPEMMDMQIAIIDAEEAGNPDAVLDVVAQSMRVTGIIYLVAAIFYPMMIAGLLRHLLRGEEPRLPFNISFGIDELNVIVATVLVFLMFFAVMLVGTLAVTLFAVLIGFLLSNVSQILAAVFIGLTFVGLFAGFIWFSIRMSLIYPAAVGERKIGIAESWTMSEGHLGGLTIYWSLWGLVLIVLTVGFLVFFMAGYLPLMIEMFQSADDPDAVNEINRRMMEEGARMYDLSGPRGWMMGVIYYVTTMITTTIYVVPGGMAYRFLTEGRD